MTVYSVPLNKTPNQIVSTTLDGTTYFITLETRLGELYISIKVNDKDVLLNRICLDRTPVGFGFVFVNIDGKTNPTYETLGGRHLLLWSGQ